MTTYTWPSSLKPSSFGFYPMDADISGGAATLSEQFIVSPGGRWGADMTLPIRTKEQILAIRGLRARLMGRAHWVALPNFDGKRLSWPEEVYNGMPTGRILHPGVTRNPDLDGTAYEDPAIPASSEIIATIGANAPLRATGIVINKTQGGAILAGQQIGIAQRLYEISQVNSVVGAMNTVTVWPPLRAAATVGTSVLFTRPLCLMRVMNLGEEMRKLDLMRFATLNLSFLELTA